MAVFQEDGTRQTEACSGGGSLPNMVGLKCAQRDHMIRTLLQGFAQ
jgi:hypothetical protein